MFCPDCGSPCQNFDTVCVACGCDLTQAAKKPEPREHQRGYTSARLTPQWVPFNMKELAGSGTFLAAIICLTIATAWRLIVDLFGSETAVMLQELSDYYETDTWSNVLVVVSVISSIPADLMLIGLWILYASAKGRGDVNATGFTLVRVAQMVNIGVLCLSCVIIIGVLFSACGQLAGYDTEVNDFQIMMTLMGAVVGVVVLIIVFHVKTLNVIQTAKESMEAGHPAGDVSKFVAVMCHVLGVITVLTSLTELDGPGILQGASYILFGQLTFTFRDTMDSMIQAAHREYERSAFNLVSTPPRPQEKLPTWKRIEMGLQDDE